MATYADTYHTPTQEQGTQYITDKLLQDKMEQQIARHGQT